MNSIRVLTEGRSMRTISFPPAVLKVSKAIARLGEYQGDITYVAGSTNSCPLAREFGHSLGTGNDDSYAPKIGLTSQDVNSFRIWVDNTHRGVFVALKTLIRRYL